MAEKIMIYVLTEVITDGYRTQENIAANTSGEFSQELMPKAIPVYHYSTDDLDELEQTGSLEDNHYWVQEFFNEH